MALKYICPVRAYGLKCLGSPECGHAMKSERISLEIDRRIFTPVARSSYAWEREYKKRTAVERVNSRLDVSFGFERHFIRGQKKMEVWVGLALCVMLAMAVGRIKEKHQELMRSLVKSPPHSTKQLKGDHEGADYVLIIHRWRGIPLGSEKWKAIVVHRICKPGRYFFGPRFYVSSCLHRSPFLQKRKTSQMARIGNLFANSIYYVTVGAMCKPTDALPMTMEQRRTLGVPRRSHPCD